MPLPPGSPGGEPIYSKAQRMNEDVIRLAEENERLRIALGEIIELASAATLDMPNIGRTVIAIESKARGAVS